MIENEPTLKAFVLEYSKVNGLDPIDVAMLAGSLISDYLQTRPECLNFVMDLKTHAPTLFQTVKLIKEGVPNND